MDRNERIQKVFARHVAMQRRAWSRVWRAALLELGETDLVILFAKDAVVNQSKMGGWA
jgi:hypothetical protein